MAMKSKTITDLFQQHIGVKQWDSFVRTMIKWFYGGFAEVKWCAISLSYMADKLNILNQFGGKEQNTYQMMRNAEAANKRTGVGWFAYAKDIKHGTIIKRGTVIFVLKEAAPMTYKSKKHTTTAYTDFTYTGAETFAALGGNQDGEIKIKYYPQSQIYAVFCPDYDRRPTVRKGDNGDAVKELQTTLKAIGFGRVTGVLLLARGHFRENTEKCLKAFQKAAGLTPDGVCGPKTWAALDKYEGATAHTSTALRNVNVRRGPGLDYKKTGLVKDGVAVSYTTIIDGWLYIPKKKGWSKSAYYKL